MRGHGQDTRPIGALGDEGYRLHNERLRLEGMEQALNRERGEFRDYEHQAQAALDAREARVRGVELRERLLHTLITARGDAIGATMGPGSMELLLSEADQAAHFLEARHGVGT